MRKINLTDEWQALTGDSIIIQATATAILYIGDEAPSANSPGFTLKWNVPIEFDVLKYGGFAAVRGTGNVTVVES